MIKLTLILTSLDTSSAPNMCICVFDKASSVKILDNLIGNPTNKNLLVLARGTSENFKIFSPAYNALDQTIHHITGWPSFLSDMIISMLYVCTHPPLPTWDLSVLPPLASLVLLFVLRLVPVDKLWRNIDSRSLHVIHCSVPKILNI